MRNFAGASLPLPPSAARSASAIHPKVCPTYTFICKPRSAPMFRTMNCDGRAIFAISKLMDPSKVSR